LKDKSIGLGND